MGSCCSTDAQNQTAGGGRSRKRKSVLEEDTSFHGNLTEDRNRKVDEVYDVGEHLALGTATEIVQVQKKLYTKNSHGSYAMKFYDGHSTVPPDLATEANILRKFDHPNIVKLYEVGKTNKRISLVMELCEGGSLQKHFPYTEKQVSRILWQLLSAVACIHHKDVVHRDINLSNILFEGSVPTKVSQSEIRKSSMAAKNKQVKDELPIGGGGEKEKNGSSKKEDVVTVDENSPEEILKNTSDIKLIDFGCATVLEKWKDGGMKGEYKFLTEKTGTVYCMAPEVVRGKYLKQADMWSVGVVAYMLLSNGKKPFDGNTAEEVERQILKGGDSVSYKGIESKKGIKFIKKLILTNPVIRLSAADALLEPFVAQGRPPVILTNKLVVAFQTFASSTPLKRVALNVLAYKASPTQIAAYRDLFRNLDIDQSNTLTKEEFVDGFSYQTGFSNDELDDLFNKLDINLNGAITYTEFLAGTLACDKIDDEDQLRDAFNQLDEDNSGSITKKNLYIILGDSPEIKNMVNEMLKGHDAVSFDKFKELFQDDVGDRNITNSVNIIREEDEDEEE